MEESRNPNGMAYEPFTDDDYQIYLSLYRDDSFVYHHNKRLNPNQSVFKTMSEVTGDEFLPGVRDREKIIDYINKVAGNDRR